MLLYDAPYYFALYIIESRMGKSPPDVDSLVSPLLIQIEQHKKYI